MYVPDNEDIRRQGEEQERKHIHCAKCKDEIYLPDALYEQDFCYDLDGEIVCSGCFERDLDKRIEKYREDHYHEFKEE
jgi:formylmethanofuran dehydrogenase subunit E